MTQEPSGTLPTLLVIDDAPFFRRMVEDILTTAGYRVILTPSGVRVPAILSNEDVAMVLCDIEMPDIPGQEVLRQIKRLRPDIPVVMVSAHHNFEAAREVLRDGALDYLTKPLAPEDLLDSVSRALKVRKNTLEALDLQREAQRRLSDLILLKEVGATASGEQDLQRLFEKVLDSISLFVDVEIASIMLLEPDGYMYIRAARGLAQELMMTTRVAPGEGISGHVLKTGEAVLIADLSQDGRFTFTPGEERYNNASLLSVPLRIQERVIGVLNVNNKRSGQTFDAADQTLLASIAHQTALAIENFKLVDNLRQQASMLEVANRHLVKFNEDRSRLVCNLSHELKTPLTSILGYLDLMQNFQDQLKPEDLKEYVAHSRDESLRMERLITGMLRLFSLDNDSDTRSCRDLDLRPLLERALTDQADKVQRDRLKVELALAADLKPVCADGERLSFLVEALIENAVKFNRPEGRLLILAENRDEDGEPHIYLQIYNDGATIPLEEGQTVFEQCTQLGDINTGKPAGVGVGLAVCRTIVERLNGRIFLEPVEGGEGTAFGVLLPLRGSCDS